MRTFYHVIEEALRRPADTLERLSTWIIAILGTAMLLIMSYAWLTAWLTS